MRVPLVASLPVFAAVAVLAPCATAQLPEPGSLLVFPEFDTRTGVANVLTVTNTNEDEDGGTIDVEFVYIGRLANDDGPVDLLCEEFNRTERLTANDTFTFLPRFHNPQMELGYLYAFAKDPGTGEAVVFNHLIGSAMKTDTVFLVEYSMNPVVYEGIGADFAPTDVDGDGIRDLNGVEYEETSDQVLIPRFFGQNFFNGGTLILINLTGGTQFDATLDFLIYNDNEDAFSAQHTFRCWDKVDLYDVSEATDNLFLKMSSNHDPNEIFGFPDLESGWLRIDGNVASSSFFSYEDPAFIAYLVEGLRTLNGSDLPFGTGSQNNGDLLPRTVVGDPE